MTKPLMVQLQGEAVPVRIRRNAQARRMVLRICHESGDIKLTLPKRAREAGAARFIEEHQDWIISERQKVAKNAPVSDGETVPIEGTERCLVYSGVSPRRVELSGEMLKVGGPQDHANGRLLAWLKTTAKDKLSARSAEHAASLGVAYKRISIGDMRSRWGSCSARGTLRYNWRLVMAPPEILNYVAAHEVAHLREMNHSSRFWALVASLDPDFSQHRAWLRAEGGRLFAIRF